MFRPGILSFNTFKGQGHFHFAKGTSKGLLKGTKAKTRGNRGHGLRGLRVIPSLDVGFPRL